VRKLDYWKIAVFVGTIIFLVSAFLPLITVTVLDTTVSITLIDLYSALTNAGEQTARDITALSRLHGILLTIVLYPITMILGFVSIAKRRAALAAGILGIICWLGATMALSSLQALQYTGLGIYMGLIGAIILLVASAPKTHCNEASSPSSTCRSAAGPTTGNSTIKLRAEPYFSLVNQLH